LAALSCKAASLFSTTSGLSFRKRIDNQKRQTDYRQCKAFAFIRKMEMIWQGEDSMACLLLLLPGSEWRDANMRKLLFTLAVRSHRSWDGARTPIMRWGDDSITSWI
jgi:hypothetical protein